MDPRPLNILLVRPGLLGDLLCATPMLAAIKQHFPFARLNVLCSPYSLALMRRNPDVDQVYVNVHTRQTERNLHPGRMRAWLDYLKLIHALRRARFDYAIVCGATFDKPGVRLAERSHAKVIIGGTCEDGSYQGRLDIPMPGLLRMEHHAIRVFRLLAPLGIPLSALPPTLSLSPDPVAVDAVHAHFLPAGSVRYVGVHITSREPSRLWPVECFAAVIRQLVLADPRWVFMLMWERGDEARGQALQAALADLPVYVHPPGTLEYAIAALSLCDWVLCHEGGALHMAAALGRPIVGLFDGLPGKYECWYPWGVPYELACSDPGLAIPDLPVERVYDAALRLIKRLDEPRAIALCKCLSKK